MKYDVTIGIPVFRAEQHIRQTLESALHQTYPSIEFLLVDDCGGDKSIDIIREIKRFHQRGNDIHIISHSENQGVSASRNQIIKEALGEYLFFMDSDDRISENAISLLMSHLHKFNAEIAFGSYEKIEPSGRIIKYQYPALHLLGENQLACFAYRKVGGIQASACNYLVKTALIRDNNYSFINANYWEDLVFTFDLVPYITRAVLLSDITYTYQCREDSLSHYQSRKQIPKEEILQNIQTINYLKETSTKYNRKVYYSNRCYIIMMMDIYMAFYILKQRKEIIPNIADVEIKSMMLHPASFRQICSFRQLRFKNFFLYLFGKMPSPLCMCLIWCVGKVKKIL